MTLFKNLTVGIIGLAVAAAIVLFIYWLLWLGWSWALPQLWPAGPAGVIQPGYWLFSVTLFVVMFIGRGIFGGSAKE